MSTYEQAKKLLAEAEAARAKAVEELLAQRAEVDKKLADLGHVDAPAVVAHGKKASGIAAVCQVCGFGTTPPHDQRFKIHREQPEAKPLTDAELKKAGLVKKP